MNHLYYNDYYFLYLCNGKKLFVHLAQSYIQLSQGHRLQKRLNDSANFNLFVIPFEGIGL